VTDPQPTPGTGWSVITTVPRTLPDAAGVLTAGQEITFVTGRGQTGTVFVPQRQMTADYAKSQIQAQATLLDSIMDLKG